MKFRSLQKWDAPQQCPGLVYFAQLLEEMLFDFSLDTYRASVMHTGILCQEALLTIQQIDQGNIRAPNLGHVISEFCADYAKDPVAQALIPVSYDSFYPTLRNPKSAHKEIQTILELFAIHLTLSKYRDQNELLLAGEIAGQQNISRIRRLARSYVTTLIGQGFNQKFVHDTTLDFFHYGSNRISGASAALDFFSLFPKETQDFDVVFRVDRLFEHPQETFRALGLTVSKSLPADIDLASYPDFKLKTATQTFGVASKVKARDIHSARLMAENLLKLCSTLVTLYHHKESPEWSPECIVRTCANGEYRKVGAPINSMHRCSDLLPPVASRRLAALMSNFSLRTDSFLKFIRSAQLHSMALVSSTTENQILNLWIALESLIPSETKSEDSSNIEHVVTSLMPFLNLTYLDDLVNNVGKDLLRWNSFETKKALRGIDGKKLSEKLAKLLVVPQFATQLTNLKVQFRDFHLLRDRISYFETMLRSPQNVVAALDAHRTRLEWQLRRIYRTRNIIVHSGNTPGYTAPLIEHTHDYLDSVLNSLIALASTPKTINSVGQGFKYVEMKYAAYYSALKEKGLQFDGANIGRLLFTGS
jgi:hypothetical protein